MPLIKLNNITKTYPPANVLDEICLELHAGETVAIMGASGSGKSTLLHIIGLLDRPTSGEYFFLNKDTFNFTKNEMAQIRNQKIGFIFQSFYLLPKLSVLENIMLPLFYRKLSKDKAKQKALYILEKIGMLSYAAQTPLFLSGGQQQRVAIARALVGDPEIILADEPTGALDLQTGKAIMNLIMDLNAKENKTILLITHDEAISKYCQKVKIIKDGKIY